MKLLMLTKFFPPLEYKSVSQVAFDQARALTQKGVEVTVITQNHTDQNIVRKQSGVTIHYVGSPDYIVSTWELDPLKWTWAYWDYIRRHINLREFDVIHSQDIDFAILVRFLTGILDAAFIAQFHVCYRKRADIGEVYFDIELAHYYQYILAHSADLVVAVSNAEKKYLGKYVGCENKTVVVPNGVNVEECRSHKSATKETRDRYRLDDDFVILCGGRLWDFMKGADIAGQVFSRIVNLKRSAKLVLALPPMPNILTENLRYLLDNLSPEARSRTLVLYPETRKELLDLYAASNVFIMPSRYEPFGLMAIEAMACGTPLIVSAVDGLDEIIQHGENGLKIPMRDHGETIDKLVYFITLLMENEDYAKLLSQNAKISVTKYDIHSVAGRLLETYRDAIVARRRPTLNKVLTPSSM